MGKLIDLSGQRFGRLTVVERAGTKVTPCGSKRTLWLCKCDCGNTTITATQELKKGDTKSCGCYQRDRISEVSTTHGMRRTKLYHRWLDMRQRCSNPKNSRYSDWGGRGITVCDEWQQFEPFRDWALANGYRDDLTLDRIDVNGNYEPSNCRWITNKEQCNNKRVNSLLTYNGKTQTISQWADEVNINPLTLGARIKNGWSTERALTEPVHTEKGNRRKEKK